MRRNASLLLALACLLGCRQDMHDQPRLEPFEENRFFEDGRSPRPLQPGTIARGRLREDRRFYEGRAEQQEEDPFAFPVTDLELERTLARMEGDGLTDTFPIEVTPAVVERGRTQFEIFCQPCHGASGDGDGEVVKRGFRAPPSYHSKRLLEAPVGHFFDVMTRGLGAMEDFADRLTAADRWAIAAFIRELQKHPPPAAEPVESAPTINPSGGEIEIRITASQWLWRVEHAEGRKELNSLHLPAGQPVRLVLETDDVRHRVSLPGLGVNEPVRPGQVSEVSFIPREAGLSVLQCTEYCGAGFAQMRGRVVVRPPRAYQQWLSGVAPGETPFTVGQRLFSELKCDNCHRPDGAGRGPTLDGVLGRTVNLRGNVAVIADEAYLRESVLNPQAKLVEGFEPVMPVFEGKLSEEQLAGLLEYLRSLQGAP